MITGIKSAIICDEFQKNEDGRVNYLGVHTDPLRMASRPCFIDGYLCLQINVDKRQTAAQLTIQAPDYSQSFPLNVPAGWSMIEVSSRLIIAATQPGELIASIIDERGKPIRARWEIQFGPNCEILDPEEATALLNTVTEMQSHLRIGMPTH